MAMWCAGLQFFIATVSRGTEISQEDKEAFQMVSPKASGQPTGSRSYYGCCTYYDRA